jgi:hypothetical protein
MDEWMEEVRRRNGWSASVLRWQRRRHVFSGGPSWTGSNGSSVREEGRGGREVRGCGGASALRLSARGQQVFYSRPRLLQKLILALADQHELRCWLHAGTRLLNKNSSCSGRKQTGGQYCWHGGLSVDQASGVVEAAASWSAGVVDHCVAMPECEHPCLHFSQSATRSAGPSSAWCTGSGHDGRRQ